MFWVETSNITINASGYLIPTLQDEAPEDEFNRPDKNPPHSKNPVGNPLLSHTHATSEIQKKKKLHQSIPPHRAARSTQISNNKQNHTFRDRGMAIPTMNKKKGITKSARLQPFHGACPITGHSPPAPSTRIISCTSEARSP